MPKVMMATPSTRRSIIRRTALSIRFGIISGGGEQDFVAVLDCNGFEDLNDFRKEWIGNFRDDETKNPAAPGNQRPRLSIRVVAQFLDYAPDALGQRGIDGGNAVDGAGHGGG